MASASMYGGCVAAALPSLIAVFGSVVLADAAAADETAELQEIVVTAQRRQERLQDVPLAVSAFSESDLRNAKVQTLSDLDGKLPNVSLSPVGAFPFGAAFSIRGLGFTDIESTFEPTVGVEINGVYLARNVGAVTDLFDVENVTVLRGPQGTLYGRNTIGGVVSFRTKRPGSEFGADAQETLGSYGRREFRGALEAPIAPGLLSVRVSTLVKDYAGFYHNLENGNRIGADDSLAFRGTVRLTPTPTFDATLILEYLHDRGDGPAQQNVSLPTQVLATIGFAPDPNDPPYSTRSHLAHPIANLDIDGATLEMNWELGPVELTSITGERYTKYHDLNDYTGVPVRLLDSERFETHHQFSEELRVASAGQGPLKYVAGLYYMNQRFDLTGLEGGVFFGGPDVTVSEVTGQTARSYAAFGQVDYEVISRLTLTLGGRYSYDLKRFTLQPFFIPTSRTFEKPFNDFSPKAAISYQWTPDMLTYVQYSRGYRAGGFNGRAGTLTAAGPYGSEHVNSYEIGMKNELFDRRVTLNLAAFTSKYDDMQQSVQQVVPGTTTNQTLTLNASSAKIKGVESELSVRVTQSLSLSGSAGYLDAKFEHFVADLGDGLGTLDRSNLPLVFAPRWSANLGATHTLELPFGKLTTNVNARYKSKLYTSFSPLNAYSSVAVRAANTLLDASLALSSEDERWRVALWGKNLADRVVINNSYPVGSLDALRIYEAPRELGVDFGVKF